MGTELLRDRETHDRYVTIDRWASEAAFREFREGFATEFENIDRRCAALTSHETALGEFADASGETGQPW